MIEIVHNRLASVLARLLVWSLVSVPTVWLPVYWPYQPPNYVRVLMPAFVFGLPFLLLAVAVSFWLLGELGKTLKGRPEWQRLTFGFAGVLLSAPNIVAIGWLLAVAAALLAVSVD